MCKFNIDEIIICVDNDNVEDHLTLNKKYKVVECSLNSVVIYDNDGEDFSYFPHRFESISQKRNNIIDEILV